MQARSRLTFAYAYYPPADALSGFDLYVKYSCGRLLWHPLHNCCHAGYPKAHVLAMLCDCHSWGPDRQPKSDHLHVFDRAPGHAPQLLPPCQDPAHR